MMGLSTIIAMNKQAARKSRGIEPFIAAVDGDINVFSLVPHLGYRRPRSWKLVHTYFVDASGFGQAGEPALTAEQFQAKVKAGFGYAIIEQGQFQVYVGEFQKRGKK